MDTIQAPLPAANTLMIPQGVYDFLPSMVRAELATLSAQQQEEFNEEFRQKEKQMSSAYLCSLLFLHYAFLGRWGLSLIMWLLVPTFFVPLTWWLIDLFRIPALVRNYNRDVAIDVLRNMKAIRN